MFTRDSRPRIDTLIGSSARVAGDLEFAGGLHLDGRIAGNVRAARAADSTLSISESGCIEGTVTVPDVELHGTVKGDIHASARVVLGATARVEGNVYYGVIEITLGAQIKGKLVRLPPGAAAPPPPLVEAGSETPAGFDLATGAN
jgi:cytoskeletal protein CcmA (bactofilin family)